MEKLRDLFILSALFCGSSLFADQPPGSGLSGTSDAAGKLSATGALPASSQSGAAVVTKAQQDLYLQTLGHIVARNAELMNFGLTSPEIEQLISGIKSALNGGEPPLSKPQDVENMQSFFEQREKEQIESNRKLGETFLKGKEKEPGVKKTASGLLYKIVKEGDTMRANEDCTVEIDYEGKLIGGKIFDSTYERGERASLYLGMLIPGFREAITLIGNGGEIEAFFPSDLAYGDEMMGPIAGGSTLIFSIKVHKIIPGEASKESKSAPVEIKSPTGSASSEEENFKVPVKEPAKR
jgi:FKBP-type peptidyl-prolyl cis-trans isomerase FkpA/FKBP-type peptidyl-prolyl cis-trans isomerase FklB